MGTDLLSSIRFQQKRVFAGSGDLGTGRIPMYRTFFMFTSINQLLSNLKWEEGGVKIQPYTLVQIYSSYFSLKHILSESN